MSLKKTEAPEDIVEQFDGADRKIDRLRVLYEQYFAGVEKLPPYNLQRDVVRIIHDLSSLQLRRTNEKFRLQAILQRFSVYRSYWLRVMRAIEEGTFTRDIRKAQARELARSGERLDTSELAKRRGLLDLMGEDAVEDRRRRQSDNEEEGPGLIPKSTLIPVASRRVVRKRKNVVALRGATADSLAQRARELEATAVASSVRASTGDTGAQIAVPAAPQSPALRILENAGITPTRARDIHASLVAARRSTGEAVDNLTFDRIVESLAKQVSRVQDTHGANHLDFDVVTQDNKAYLKPVLK